MPQLESYQQLVNFNEEIDAKNWPLVFQNKLDQALSFIVKINPNDFDQVNSFKRVLAEIGLKQQADFYQTNSHLTNPLQQLLSESSDDKNVYQLLKSLHTNIDSIHPPSAKPTLKDRFLLLFSIRESAIEMWMDELPDKKQKIEKIIDHLNKTKQQFHRDNLVLTADQKQLRTEVQKLEQVLDFTNFIEEGLKNALNDSAAQNKDLIRDEILPIIQSRFIEIQQQVLIARQAKMTLDLIVNQNTSFMRNIEQTIFTTTSAVDVATSLAMAKNIRSKQTSQQDDNQKTQKALKIIEKTLNQWKQTEKEFKEGE